MKQECMPNHVALIMDGNGRWAKARGLSRSMGHKEGAKMLERLVRHVFQKGIKYFSVYAFSRENFKRDQKEVDYLMNLLLKWFEEKKNLFLREGIRVVVSGRRDKLPKANVDAVIELEHITKDGMNGVLNICLDYSGHLELIDATKKILKDVEIGNLNIDTLDEKIFAHYLYHKLPPVDLMIRTSGEYRISNFMPWQLAYAEFYFCDTYFPDFDEACFDEAIEAYGKRNRRFGGNEHEEKSH